MKIFANKTAFQKIVTVVLVICFTLLGVLSAPVSAENEITEQACSNSKFTEDQKAALGCKEKKTAPSVVTNILNGVIAVLAIVCIIIIIVAGQRFITAKGDPGQVQQAKNMILYAVIGLIIAGLAFAIVNFILNAIS